MAFCSGSKGYGVLSFSFWFIGGGAFGYSFISRLRAVEVDSIGCRIHPELHNQYISSFLTLLLDTQGDFPPLPLVEQIPV